MLREFTQGAAEITDLEVRLCPGGSPLGGASIGSSAVVGSPLRRGPGGRSSILTPTLPHAPLADSSFGGRERAYHRLELGPGLRQRGPKVPGIVALQ
jgi:hypothetical protein